MTDTTSPFTPQEQLQCLNLLDYLSDLFTGARKETFSREQILVIIDHVRSDENIFDPDVVIAQQSATAEMGE